jgi:uncharacterized protein (TIGR02246 family)
MVPAVSGQVCWPIGLDSRNVTRRLIYRPSRRPGFQIRRKDMRVALMALMVLVLQPCSGAVAVAGDDEAAIRARNQSEIAAWNAGDAKAMAMLYDADATWIDTSRAASRGRDAITTLFVGWFAGEFKGTTLALTEEGIQLVKPDVAVVDGTWTISGMRAPDGTETPSIKGFYLGTYVKKDGKWLVAALQSLMPPLPPGP